MEPIFLEPVYKYNIWGGNKISEIKDIEEKRIGESWEIAANSNGTNIIKNGNFAGLSLIELFNIKELRKLIFGKYCIKAQRFPLLIKIIDAKENLSVQVHPNNYRAKKMEKDSGKTELWYILDCEEDGKIICGLKSKKNIKLTKDNIKDNINYLPIEKDAFVLMEAGTIHAILKNTLIYEIQQNSDITYRVYDWDRDDENRKLHLKKTRRVTNYKKQGKLIKSPNSEGINNICHNKYFCVDKIIVNKKYEHETNLKSFQAFNVIKGEGKLIVNDIEYEIKSGTSFILPAKLGKYKISGNLELLKTYLSKKISN